MTRDAHVLAQIHLAQLRVMASRHRYTHDGSLEDITVSNSVTINLVPSTNTLNLLIQQARALLSVIIVPLLRHLSVSEYNNIVASLDRAEVLLSHPLEELNKLVTSWRIQNIALLINWTSHPLDGADSYYFGGPAPVEGFRLEDILTPLPYPTKIILHDRLSALPGREELSKTQFGADDIPSRLNNIPDVSSPSHKGFSYVALPPLVVDGRAVSWASGSSSETWVSVNNKVSGNHKYAAPLKLDDYRTGPEQYLIYEQSHPNNYKYPSEPPSSRNILHRMGSRAKALLIAR